MSHFHVMVDAVVQINDGCPIKAIVSEDGELAIVCGQTINERFEFGIGPNAARELVRVCSEVLAKLDGANPQ